MTTEEVEEMLRELHEQGLPAKVTDPLVMAQIAALIRDHLQRLVSASR